VARAERVASLDAEEAILVAEEIVSLFDEIAKTNAQTRVVPETQA